MVLNKAMDKMIGLHIKTQLKLQSFFKDERGNEFNDGGSTNWGRNVAIGFAIAAAIFILVKAVMPEVVNAWKAKLMNFFNISNPTP